MLCCAAYGEAVSIMSCLANKRHNNGGGSFAARCHASTRGRDDGRGFDAHIKMSDKTPRGVTNMFRSRILSRRIHTCSVYAKKKNQQNSVMCSGGEHAETHTLISGLRRGQGTHCHTHTV